MKSYEEFLAAEEALHSGDVDTLILLSDLVQSILDAADYETVGKILLKTLSDGSYDAAEWIIGGLNDAAKKKGDCANAMIFIPLGRTIPAFDAFLQILQTDLTPSENYVQKIPDKNGEIESFYNISKYTTRFTNVNLVQAENFDTKDNDFILYSLQCSFK